MILNRLEQLVWRDAENTIAAGSAAETSFDIMDTYIRNNVPNRTSVVQLEAGSAANVIIQDIH